MKRFIVLSIVILIIGFIVYTLFNNRASMQKGVATNRISASSVLVVPVAKQIVDEQFSQEGLIVGNNEVTVTSSVQGPITGVYVKVGDYVKAGTSLVQVFDGDAYIKAPITGVVAVLPATIGMTLNPGTVIANIVDISRLKVNLNIGEQDVFKLKVGEPAEVETDVYPGVKYFGKIENISIKADEVHTYLVQVGIPNNQQYQLKSGMFGKVSFDLGNYPALVIPRNTLIGSVQSPQVFVVKDGIARLRDIQVGSEVNTNIIVHTGLEEGETVVLSGQENLKDNAPVAVVDNNFNQDSTNSHGKFDRSGRKRPRQGVQKYKSR